MPDLFPLARDALLSPCGAYRFTLSRQLEPEGTSSCVFIMLNPSRADATDDDPTVRKCMKFAKAWGYSLLHVVNLFAWRDKSPAAMKLAKYPVGENNDVIVRLAASRAGIVVCAWGKHGTHLDRHNVMRQQLHGWGIPVHYLALNKDGTPKHPLYCRDDTVPTRWEFPDA